MFQSRSFKSSPGTYLRCSLNSTEKPWNGLACRPARNPSTMNLARRSSRATWRITSGRRYLSAAAMRESPSLRSRLYGFLDEQLSLRAEEPLVVDLVDAVGLLRQIPA